MVLCHLRVSLVPSLTSHVICTPAATVALGSGVTGLIRAEADRLQSSHTQHIQIYRTHESISAWTNMYLNNSMN